jgi:hypothetical protein
LTERSPSPVDSPTSVNRTPALTFGSLPGFGRTVAEQRLEPPATSGRRRVPAQNFALIASP